MKSLHLLLVLLLVVITVHAEKPKGVAQKRPKRHVDLVESLRPLRRYKRRWVLTTIVLEENDSGPFPKYAGDLFNDRAENHSIRYLIKGPGVDEEPEIGLFHINDLTGQVYVNRAIDREKTAMFVIRFDVQDRLTKQILDNSLIFNVEVMDKNDNAPEFSESVYDVPLKETVNLDNPVYQVTARDKDKEDTANSDITYYLVNQIPGNVNVKFSVDPKNGLIRGQGCLNYENINMIRLIIGARDNGEGKLANTVTVNFWIQDGNNNMPLFTPSNYELSIHEGEVKYDILRLKVEDKDLPNTPAWKAKFKMLSGNDKQNFNLSTDPVTNEGIFSIIKALDFEGATTFTVAISVENEEPFLSCENTKLRMDSTKVQSKANVSISVVDTNDAPVFSPLIKIIRETENVKAGTTLATLTATDPDKVPNKIRYQIAKDPADWVSVDENTGVLTTKKELDRESPYVNQTLYTVIVYAIDNGEPPGTGTGTVLLYVSDQNDNTPRLVAPHLERCEQKNQMPLIVSAVDKDMDPYSGPFRFEIAEHSRAAMKDTWRMTQNSGDSVELSMLRSLPKGNYTVPMNIYDRQGTYSEQVLNVRICGCPDGQTCEKLEPASYQMGGGAIGAIIGALLLFLLALCLLMCFLCGSGGKKHRNILANDDGNQTLIQYNEEGGSALSNASPATLMMNGNGNIELKSQSYNSSYKDKEAVGRSLSSTIPRAPYQSWEHEKEAVGRTISGTMPRAQYQSWDAQNQVGQSQIQNGFSQTSKYSRNGSFKNRKDNVFVEKIGEILNHRLREFPNADDTTTYKPRVYAYEGELERIDSVGSFSFPETNMDFSFLDDFDPKFANLEKICQQLE